MNKDEMKGRISMALKDPILQQGFEIICKRLVILEKENAEQKEEVKQKFNEWLEENGGKKGTLYQSFSDDELEHIFKSAYVKNDKR